MKRLATILATCLIALVAVVPAVAVASGGSTCSAYNPQNCTTTTATTTTVVSTSVSTSTAATAVSTLPFTGLDVGLMIAGGVVLVGAGLIVRSAARHARD